MPLRLLTCWSSCPSVARRYLQSFPTRRSSDLLRPGHRGVVVGLPQRVARVVEAADDGDPGHPRDREPGPDAPAQPPLRSEEHTSELQSRGHLVCRLLLEKQNKLKQV